ncbi:Cytosine deaminase [Lentibacillus sp. JNUCC-1]|uniref:nucleoside deaminase n=1 Tax=Lentibacillus sp. JNUCC-1 TaxID=2654513 RepID=UPI00132ADA97|nr:Cytosine deaminase [Lentibacillus sp. JNUCC-1]
MDQFMKRAVELAADTVREGGQPFGAVLVKDGEVITEGANEVHKVYDVSAHAELVAIRKAQEKLQTHDLSGYVMYASGEPCPMCLTAMFYAGLQKAIIVLLWKKRLMLVLGLL